MKVILSQNRKEKPDFNSLGFGKYMSDHMLVMDYAVGKWGEFEIVPYQKLSLDPASHILHYGQGIFEGLKAYKNKDDEITLFRPRDNLLRLNASAERMCMPKIDVEKTLVALKELIRIEADWIPALEGTSLYIRPTMFCADEFLGVRPGLCYKFYVILCPVGAYYEKGMKPIKIYIEDYYTRAVPGGTGEAKCVGNYGASYAGQLKAQKLGFDQALWLDGKEKKYIEEVGSMNIFFVLDDTVVTPALTGSVLKGITRDSIIKILESQNCKVEERKISIEEVIKAQENGALKEIFGTGTAAVVSSVGELYYNGKSYTVGDGNIGKKTRELYDNLTGIQTGRLEDSFGWIERVNTM